MITQTMEEQAAELGADKIVAGPGELAAGKLIDVWCDNHNGRIPWDKAVRILSICTKMNSDEEKRLLELN